MRRLCFRFAFSLLFSAALLALPEGASAQSGTTLQFRTSFAAQYDTNLGWRPDYGVRSVHNSLAEPTIAAGPANGGTRLLLGANNSIGNFFNALRGPDDVSNAQQDLASVFYGLPLSGFVVTQPQVMRDRSPFQLPDLTGTADRYVIVAIAKNYSTQESRILISATQYTATVPAAQCLLSFNVNDSQDTGMFADSVHLGTSANALMSLRICIPMQTRVSSTPSCGSSPKAPSIMTPRSELAPLSRQSTHSC